jgi:hypothetical protein
MSYMYSFFFVFHIPFEIQLFSTTKMSLIYFIQSAYLENMALIVGRSAAVTVPVASRVAGSMVIVRMAVSRAGRG